MQLIELFNGQTEGTFRIHKKAYDHHESKSIPIIRQIETEIVQLVNEWVHRIMYETGRQMNDQMGKQIDTDIFSRIDKYNNELIEQHKKMSKTMLHSYMPFRKNY